MMTNEIQRNKTVTILVFSNGEWWELKRAGSDWVQDRDKGQRKREKASLQTSTGGQHDKFKVLQISCNL